MSMVLHSHVSVARFVLETKSPLSIASGQSSMRFDTLIVRDANNLPTVPGTSLAGVLRQLYGETFGTEQAKGVFGYGHQRGEEENEDQRSRLDVSWGCVHGSKGVPVERLLHDGMPKDEQGQFDPILAFLLDESPVHRQRVKMNHRGVSDAEQHGLFDRSAVPAGCRFSFEIALWSEQREEDTWNRIRTLFSHPGLRLGGATRAGLGNVECVAWYEKPFDLGTQGGYNEYSELAFSPLSETDYPDDDDKSNAVKGGKEDVTGWHRRTIRLQPENGAGWRIGGTSHKPLNHHGKKAPDDVPHTEAFIDWPENNQNREPAKLSLRRAVAPASSIKGALSHRVAFHANCLGGRWAESDDDDNPAFVGENSPEVVALFGCAKGNDGKGQAGRVYIEDAYLESAPKTHWQMHNKQDRFTGGVIRSALFGEEVIWNEHIDLTFWIKSSGVSDEAREAFKLALNDLKEGRLALGAGASRGHGWFSGEEVGHDAQSI